MSWFGNPSSGAENWSLYPALQTVSMNNNILGTATEIQGTNVVLTNTSPEVEFNSGTDKIEMYRAAGDSTVRVSADKLLNNGGFVLDTRLNPPSFNLNGSNLELRAKDPAGTNYVMSSVGFTAPTIKAGAWYKTSAQTIATTGGVNINWNTSAYGDTSTISQNTVGGSAFTVNQAGIYNLMLQLQLSNLGNATFTDRTFRANITLNRGGNSGVIITSSYDIPDAIPTNPAIQTIGQYRLEVGDQLTFSITTFLSGGNFIILNQGAPPSTFDLNTSWTWALISADGNAPYVAPAPIIQAAGTTALTPNNANSTFILTSGTIQNFTTAALGSLNTGLVWYVKNGQAQGGGGNDVLVRENGGAIAGVTSTLHQGTNTSNTSTQTLYWNGTNLVMF